MRYKISNEVDAFGKEYYQVIDTHSIKDDTDEIICPTFNNLQDAKICVAKLNGIKGGVLWDGSSSEHGTDYFELGELITISADVESDIEALIDKIDRHSPRPSEIKETLQSIKNLHSLRYERVFDYFSEMIKKGYIKPSEIYEEV